MRNMATGVAVLLLAAAFGAGCKSQPTVSNRSATGASDEPLWITKGAYAFPNDLGKALYGVGVVEKAMMPDLYVRRTQATERARNEVAKQIRTMVTSVFKDYTQVAFTPQMTQAERESLTSTVQRSVTDEVIMGAQPYDQWTDPATGDLWVCVRLGMDGAVQQLRGKIIETEKGRLQKDAAAAHKELDAIIDKHRQQGK